MSLELCSAFKRQKITFYNKYSVKWTFASLYKVKYILVIISNCALFQIAIQISFFGGFLIFI